MNKEQLIALGLTEEQADKVVAGFGTMVPKTRLDEKINEVKDLKTQLTDRDTQLEELKKIDAEGLQAKITELQKANDDSKTAHEQQLKDVQMASALKLALTGKVHDADLVSGLVDKTKIELNEDGTIKGGLDEQVKSLQEAKSFLFVPETKPSGIKPGGDPGGGNPGAGGENNFGQKVADFAKSSTNLDQARNSYFD